MESSVELPMIKKQPVTGKVSRSQTPYRTGKYLREDKDIDLNTGGIYVELFNGEPVGISPYDMREKINTLQYVGTLLGVPKSNESHFKKFCKANPGKWVTLTEFIGEELNAIVKALSSVVTSKDLFTIAGTHSISEEHFDSIFSAKYLHLWEDCKWDNPKFKEFMRLTKIRNSIDNKKLYKSLMSENFSTDDDIVYQLLKENEFLRITCCRHLHTGMESQDKPEFVRGLVKYLNTL
jgi:hypothetical protein